MARPATLPLPLALLVFSVTLAPAGEAAPGRVHVTEFGRRVLSRCDAVVEAKVLRVNPPFRGVSTARLAVSERLLGRSRRSEITLMFVQDYVAPEAFNSKLTSATVRYERRRKLDMASVLEDLARSRVPEKREELTGERTTNEKTERSPAPNARTGGAGIRLVKDEQALFFLRRRGASYSLVGYIPQRDPLYDSKRERLTGVLRLERPGALDERLVSAKRYFLREIKSDNPWERGNAARELRSLARRDPRLFTRSEGRRLAALMIDEREPPIQWSLERAVHAIDPNLALEYARRAESEASERHAATLAEERKRLLGTTVPELRAADLVRIGRRYRRAAAPLLVEFLKDRAPIVRERVAQALAEIGSPNARKPLREALARETDDDAATALVYACGTGGDPDAVPTLAAQLGKPARERVALHALARIGTAEARVALEKHRDRASRESRELIDTLLREEFANR